MDPKLIMIPVGLIIVGVIVMIALNKKASKSTGKAQNVMRDYVLNEIPTLKGENFNVINLLEDAVSPEHIWVVAYSENGMFFIPSKSNPITQTIKRFEDIKPIFDLRKQIASSILAGNKSENIDYVPFSSITDIQMDDGKKSIKISIGETTKNLKYQLKDCFGADQETELNKLFSYLRQ